MCMLDGNVMLAKPYKMRELAVEVKKLLNNEKKILLVDDETDILTVLEKGLTGEDFSVIAAETGTAALDMAKSERPDLIILDLEMPDIYSGDIARMLKEDPETQNIPIMFLTGMFPKNEEPGNGRMVGGHVLFTKPYSIEELATTITRMNEKTILIIDDEMDLRLVLEKALTAEEYDVITASGNEGIASAKLKQPDLIILDRALGDMLGEEVAAKLQSYPKTKDIPIVFLSALFSKTDEVEKCHSFNGKPMFAKPYDMVELLAGGENVI